MMSLCARGDCLHLVEILVPDAEARRRAPVFVRFVEPLPSPGFIRTAMA